MNKVASPTTMEGTKPETAKLVVVPAASVENVPNETVASNLYGVGSDSPTSPI